MASSPWNPAVLWLLALPVCGIVVAFLAVAPNPPAREKRNVRVGWSTGLTPPAPRPRRGPGTTTHSARGSEVRYQRR